MFPLWMTIEPRPTEVRILLTEPSAGPSLKARLPLPAQARAVPHLLESLALWYGRPLHAVLDADAEDVRLHPERWALLAGDLPILEMSVEWARRPHGSRRKEHARFLESMGDFRSARHLLGFATTGMP
jgi:hypothetical protein